MNEWISVNDKLPGNRTLKLIVCNVGGRRVVTVGHYYPECGGWYDYMAHEKLSGTVTHWMPMPMLPKEES